MQLKIELIQQIQSIIINAKERAIRSVDTERVLMYWHIGKAILDEEQQGKERAGYGEFLIKSLAQSLQPKFGSGFSIRQLEMCRQFYRVFPIANALRSQFNWTHYRTLIRIDNQDKRDFYIAEAEKNNWTARQAIRTAG
jgi:predicted nuclease of restriction endonuclease-like (RecB) superfamily